MPNLPIVIPAMDLINEEFRQYHVNTNTLDAIHVAIEVGKRTLDRYYSKTDDIGIYCIAMGKCCFPNSLRLEIDKKKVLHPCYKLSYFRTAKWQQYWINTAHEIVEQEYEWHYLNLDVIQPEEGPIAEKEQGFKEKDKV